MTKQQFKITIAAPKEIVWDALWQDETYREWTSAFSEGSHAITDWKKGSKVHFLDGNGQGMFSRIADRRDNDFMSIQHLGLVKDGQEVADSQESEEWQGYENYTLTEDDGKTEVVVDLSYGNQSDDIIKMFAEIFPKALAKLREIAERKASESIELHKR